MAKLKFNPAAYQDLGAYALLKNVVENGHLVTDGGTLPASVEAVTESRELKPSDINKFLYIPQSILDVYLSFPTKNFFKDGDILGFATESMTSYIELNNVGQKLYPNPSINPTGSGNAEVVILRYTAALNELVALTGGVDTDVPKETKTPARYLLEKIPNYKVYTALLTQSGGDSPFTLNSGPLTIGVTYEIVDILIGKVNTFTILNPGTGYVDETSGTSGGNGFSLSFGITQTGGVIDSLTIIDPGAGYHVNDIVTITSGNGNATVRIDSVLSDDFTNVGASSNANGVKFIATGTTPTSWLAGSTLGANSAAPTVTILENTIGNIPWTYSSEGVYQATSPLLNDSKTLLFVQATSNNSPNNVGYYLRFSDPDVLELTTLVEGYGPSDNWLLNTPIEIRIYN